MTKLRLVILIDGENITCDYAEEIFKKTDNLGEAVVRRVYLPHGNTTWENEVIHRHGIEPIYKIRYANKKNVMDIAMVMDAMDLMYQGRSIYDGFCIASNDSDFTQLAIRLREEGFKVFGFGDERARDYLAPSCSEFIPLTKSPDTKAAEEKIKAEKEAKEKKAKAEKEAKEKKAQAEKGVKMVINAMQKTEKEWVSLGMIGKYLREIDPNFKINHYGYKTLKKLVTEKSEFFETRPGKDANNLDVRIREKKKK